MLQFFMVWSLMCFVLTPCIAQEGSEGSVVDANSYCDSGRQLGPKTYQLSKSLTEKRTVAVLQISAIGEAVLNLENSMQMPPIKLSHFSLNEARQRWGVPKEWGETKSFELWTRYGDTNVYHIDTKIGANAKLRAYCVRGVEITSPHWVRVEE